LDIYLVDGTYELFRHYYALPSARDSDGREVAAPMPNGDWCPMDPLLNDLRSEPEFDEILQKARQRHEAFKRAFFK
jgi:hypothetical protein